MRCCQYTVVQTQWEERETVDQMLNKNLHVAGSNPARGTLSEGRGMKSNKLVVGWRENIILRKILESLQTGGKCMTK